MGRIRLSNAMPATPSEFLRDGGGHAGHAVPWLSSAAAGAALVAARHHVGLARSQVGQQIGMRELQTPSSTMAITRPGPGWRPGRLGIHAARMTVLQMPLIPEQGVVCV